MGTFQSNIIVFILFIVYSLQCNVFVQHFARCRLPDCSTQPQNPEEGEKRSAGECSYVWTCNSSSMIKHKYFLDALEYVQYICTCKDLLHCLLCCEYQELSYKLCETLSMVAKISITDEADVSHANGSRVTTEDTLPDEVNNELPSALSGSLALLDGEGSDRDKSNSAHVKEKGRSKEESGGERRHLRAEKPSRNQKETPSPVELFQPAIQALAVLSNVRQ